MTPRRVVIWNAGAWRPAWLAKQLGALAGCRSPADDPFAPKGELHALAQGWAGLGGERARREEAVAAALAERDLMVVNLGEKEFTPFQGALVAIASRAGFRHLLLHQRDGLARLAALAGAQGSTDAPALRVLLRRERALTLNGARLRRSLQGPAHTRRLGALEDLLPTGDAASRRWRETLAFLAGTEAAEIADDAALARCRERLVREHASLLDLPATARSALLREAAFLPGVDQAPAFWQGAVHALPDPAGALRLVQLNVANRPWVEGDAAPVAGLVLLAGARDAQHLQCVQDDQVQRLDWDQPSPGLAARMPDAPGAGSARVKPFNVRVLRSAPARVELCDDRGEARRGVAEIRFEPLGRAPLDGVLVARGAIGYQAIPKVACTSIKEALFQAATGAPFTPGAANGDGNIHDFFYRRTVDISGAAFKFLLVRDPVKRLLSAYGNRVVHFKELSREYLTRLPAAQTRGLDLAHFPFDPSLDEFVARFELYCQVPTIRHHCQPMAAFVAPLSAFDKVYPFEQLDALCADLGQRLGVPFKLPHSQRGGPKLTPDQVAPDTLARLCEIYAADYALLDGLYTAPIPCAAR